jgi:hypothetical protein
MESGARRWAGVVPAVLAIAWVLVAVPQPSEACLSYYRSPDFLAADSPLIIVGEVTDVKTDPTKVFWTANKPPPGTPGPSTATVRVIRVIKGDYDKPAIEVDSGPIASCEGWPVHYTFTKGQISVFMLPAEPEAGRVALRHAGSVAPAAQTEMIESRIARAMVFRQAYLDEMERTAPKTLKAAKALCARLKKASAKWPQPKVRPSTEEARSGPFKKLSPEEIAMSKAAGDLASEIADVKIETLRTVLALAWTDASATWSRHPVFCEAMKLHQMRHEAEIGASNKIYLRALLTAAGVEKAGIDAFLDSVKDADAGSAGVTFPVYVPWGLWRDQTRDVITTQFIARFNNYDRGSMHQRYGYESQELGALEPPRVRAIILALCGSDDEMLADVGYTAINAVPGNHFLDIILRDLYDHDKNTLGCLKDHLTPPEAKRRMKGLVALACDGAQSDGGYSVWAELARRKFFPPDLIDDAIERLATAEERLAAVEVELVKARAARDDEIAKLAASETESAPEEENAKPLPAATALARIEAEKERIESQAAALRAYLENAREARKAETKKPSAAPAEEYKKWFDDNPPSDGA